VPRDDIEPGLYSRALLHWSRRSLQEAYHLPAQGARGDRAHGHPKIALRDREHLARLHPNGHGILMNTLNWPDEIARPRDSKGSRAR